MSVRLYRHQERQERLLRATIILYVISVFDTLIQDHVSSSSMILKSFYSAYSRTMDEGENDGQYCI